MEGQLAGLDFGRPFDVDGCGSTEAVWFPALLALGCNSSSTLFRLLVVGMLARSISGTSFRFLGLKSK